MEKSQQEDQLSDPPTYLTDNSSANKSAGGLIPNQDLIVQKKELKRSLHLQQIFSQQQKKVKQEQLKCSQFSMLLKASNDITKIQNILSLRTLIAKVLSENNPLAFEVAKILEQKKQDLLDFSEGFLNQVNQIEQDMNILREQITILKRESKEQLKIQEQNERKWSQSLKEIWYFIEGKNILLDDKDYYIRGEDLVTALISVNMYECLKDQANMQFIQNIFINKSRKQMEQAEQISHPSKAPLSVQFLRCKLCIPLKQAEVVTTQFIPDKQLISPGNNIKYMVFKIGRKRARNIKVTIIDSDKDFQKQQNCQTL
ncbi:UNKNOWN [Stylonychia lemnae]|uniref:Uncharacterized protein n=1 Tax=Stylonychia lemnae TaxID=5949 RepID=A0A078B0I9_STYLE|nr:UNKNOWN [Stylonychia lemnae]|eukprot:CDW86877.1 UNKNOWN [Stylonychia lemnae]